MKRAAGETEEEYNFKRKRALSGIATEEDFNKAYPGFQYDRHTILAKPLCLDDAGIRRIITSLAPSLIDCARATKIDSESSRYPFVYEILKFLVRLTGADHQIHSYNREARASDEILKQAAGDFVRESQQDEELNEETLDEMIMRWERYFPVSGRDTFGYGYVEFSVESLRDRMVKLLLEVKKHLARNSTDISEANGFFQACGEAAAARIANIEMAGQRAYDHAVQAKRLEPKPAECLHQFKTRRTAAEKVWNEEIERAGQDARNAAEEQAKALPVCVTLTDFTEWIFLKLEGTTIRASESYRLFDFTREQLTAHPTLVDALQYFCDAVGVRGSTLELDGRIQQIDASDRNQSKKFVESVYIQEMRTFVEAMQLSGVESVNAKATFAKKFPFADAGDFVKW